MDELFLLDPVMLSGLTWEQATGAISMVDCAIRRPHWCSPVAILHEGKLVIDDDGDIFPGEFTRDDRRADDWQMVPRVDDDGNEVKPTYRTTPPSNRSPS